MKTDAVQYLFPEQVSVSAGKPSPVTLHFRVAQGLHINSHTPSDQYLIPTAFSIPAGANVRLAAAAYPAGTIISLAFDPKTKLSVYTGEFTIQARIVAAAGQPPDARQAALPGLRQQPVHAPQDDRRAD